MNTITSQLLEKLDFWSILLEHIMFFQLSSPFIQFVITLGRLADLHLVTNGVINLFVSDRLVGDTKLNKNGFELILD